MKIKYVGRTQVSSFSQVGIGTTSLNNNTIFEVESNSKGVLLPRLNDSQRNNIVTPPEGLFIYNKENHRFEYYNGMEWMALDKQKVTPESLFFSEYGKGSSGNDKYVEIYNPFNLVINMSDFSIAIYSNGNTFGNIFTLSGTLNANDVFVVHHPSANATIQTQGDFTSSIMNFSGNDYIELLYNGKLLDVIGIKGDNPGNAWDVAAIIEATKDHVLTRKPTIINGNTNWLSSAGTNATDSEWVVHPDATYTGLGSHP